MRHSKKWVAIPVVLGLMASGHCAQARQVTKPTPGAANKPAGPTTTLTAANNDFAMRLFAHVRQHDPQANVFVSPFSLAQALQMTLNGARGGTRREMEAALCLKGLTRDDVNRQNQQLRRHLNAPDSGVTLAVANSLWTRAGEIRPDFVRRVQTAYGAKLGSLASGADAINGWVDAQTRHKITHVVTPKDIEGASAVLVNAVYFNGAWEYHFEDYETESQPFTTATGRKKTVKMMHHTSDYAYAKTSKFEAVTLLYKGGQYGLTCILPTPGTSLTAAATSLTPDVLTRVAKGKIQEEVELRLPRFTLHGDYRLKDILTQMGMATAFRRGKADFAEMSLRDSYLHDVLHQTFVTVNERGAEAAAATGMIMNTLSMPESIPVTFNRPFLVVLREMQSGLILFVGAVNNP